MDIRVIGLAGALCGALAWTSMAGAQTGNPTKGKEKYLQFCAPCHGPQGKGDGPAASLLPVPPRNHTDGAYMNALSDSHLAKAITGGGAAVGKSGAMPAWGTVLSEADVQDVIAHLRTLAVPPYKKPNREREPARTERPL